MPTLDQDTRDLLIRLDEKVNTILHNQEQSKTEIKHLWSEVRALQAWRTEVISSAKGAFAFGRIGASIIGTIIGAIIGIVGALGFQFSVLPKQSPPSETKASHLQHK